MATEKQIEFIKSLINDKRIENIEYFKKLDQKLSAAKARHETENNEESEYNLRGTIAYNEINRRNWLLPALGLNPYKVADWTMQDVVNAYNAKIAELDAINLQELDNMAASKLIDRLKKGL